MKRITALLAVFLTGVFSAQTFAGTVYWDIDGATAGGSGSTAATGVWDQNSTANWSTSALGDVATGTFQAGGGAMPDAVFSAGTDVVGASTVTITGSVSANSILVQEGNIIFAGASTPVLTLGGGAGAGITIAATASTTANTSFGATVTSIVLSGAQSWDVIDSGRTLSTNALTVIIGSGPLTINGASNALGKVVLANNTGFSNFTGGVTVKGGTLAIDSSAGAGQVSSAGVGTITLGDSTGSRDVTLQANTNTAKTFNNAIVVAAGSTGNTITIQGASQASNGTTWTGGITMNNAVTLASTGNTTLFSTNAIATNGNTITIKTTSATARVSISAPITGSGQLIVNAVTGTGGALLTGASTSWNGTISVISGTLAAGELTSGANALGSGAISLASGTTLSFSGANSNGTYYQNGTVTIASGSASIISPGSSSRLRGVGNFDLGAGGVGATALFDPVIQTLASSGLRLLGNSVIDITPTGTGTGTFNVYGGISDSGGSYGFTKTGTGILSLGGTMTATTDVPTLTGVASTYQGDTNIAGGTLRAGSVNALPTGTKVSIANGAVFSFAHVPGNVGTSNSNQEVAGLSDYSGTGGTVTANDTGTNLATQRILTLSGNGNYAFSGRLVDKTGSGNGVLGLAKTGSGTQTLSGASTYSGTTTISGGILQAGANNALGVQLTATGATTGVTASTTGTQGTTVSSGGTLDLNGKLFNSESITLNGTGAGGVGALVNNSGTTAVIGAGVNGLAISNVGSGYTSAPTINVTGGDGSGFSATAGLGISTISVTSGGTGYTANPTVTFSGGGGTGATGTVVRTGNVVTGITITNAGTGYTSMPTITFSTVTGASGAAASVTAGVVDIINITDLGSGYNTTAPSLSFSDGGGSGAVATATYAANPVTLASDSSIGGTGNITINTAVAESGGVRALTKVGAGTLTLSATNTYTGATSVSNGTLLVNSTGSINSSSGVSVTGGTFRYDGTTALNRNVTLNGGKFSYNSASNYGGALNFTAGTIGGSNLAGVALSIGTGKTMSPGNSTGTMAAGATTWATGGTFLFEVNDATGTAGSTTAGWDLLNAATLDITAGVGEFTLQIASLDNLQAAGSAAFDGAGNYSWLFVDAGSAITTFSASSFILDDSVFSFYNSTPGTFSISQGTGGDVDKLYLNYTGVIPEPSTYALLVGGLGLLAFLRRSSKN